MLAAVLESQSLRLKVWNWLEFEMRGQDEPEPPKRAIKRSGSGYPDSARLKPGWAVHVPVFLATADHRTSPRQ
jgi:hypothetical protein